MSNSDPIHGPARAIQPMNALTRDGRRIEARLHLDHLYRVLIARAMQRHYGLLPAGEVSDG